MIFWTCSIDPIVRQAWPNICIQVATVEAALQHKLLSSADGPTHRDA